MTFVNDTPETLLLMFYFSTGGAFGSDQVAPGKSFTMDFSSFTDGTIQVGITSMASTSQTSPAFTLQASSGQTVDVSLTAEG